MIRAEGEDVYLTPLDACSPRILMVALKNSDGWEMSNIESIYRRVGVALNDLVTNGRLVEVGGVWELDGDTMEAE
jgi:hypothetical protein